MDFSRRVCKGLCQTLDPDMGMCCGLCSTDHSYVQAVYEKVKKEHRMGLRVHFKVIEALEPSPAFSPALNQRTGQG